MAVPAAVAALSASALAAAPTFCVDKGNPFLPIDREVAQAVARADHTTAHFVEIDTRDGTDALNAHKPDFFTKLASRCDLVMGFPVETRYPNLPKGVDATVPYAATGFVLAAPGTTAPGFGQLPDHSKIGVAYLTVPTTWFAAGHGTALTQHQYSTPAELYQALEAHQVAAALIWQPWLQDHLAQTHAAVAEHRVDLPHANWSMVALYRPAAAQEAARFNRAIHQLAVSHKLATLIAPYRLPSGTNQ
ncbi:MAG: transporter substrate-binding domain-containing protein [Acidiphilium sp.]|nr:transporter substrate-binding domain-containing protein [Acidiphilium sp.]MDD4935019.1 transporter substrate-binding domain-containing protein [Acidiphilium sp.]